MNTEYKRPIVVVLVYIVAAAIDLFVLFFTAISLANGSGPGPIVFFVPVTALFLVGYALELLSRILHQAERIREKLEGPVTVAPPATDDIEYFLLDNQKSTGPFPLKVLLNRLRMGTLPGSAQVQLSGTKTWIALETLDT